MEYRNVHLFSKMPKRGESYAQHQDMLAAIGEACQRHEVEVEPVFRTPYEDLPPAYLAIAEAPVQGNPTDSIN